jgi:hypothetical protein
MECCDPVVDRMVANSGFMRMRGAIDLSFGRKLARSAHSLRKGESCPYEGDKNDDVYRASQEACLNGRVE